MAAPAGILALDLSSSVGWAFGYAGARRPLCGVWLLAKGDLGRMLASFDNELDDAILLHRPSLIVAEAPLPPTAVSNATVWRQQLSLAGMAEAAAYRHDIEFREQACSTIRLEILGTGRFPNGNAKPAILAYCERKGWGVPDHNSGDACVTWEYACRHLPAARWRRAAA